MKQHRPEKIIVQNMTKEAECANFSSEPGKSDQFIALFSGLVLAESHSRQTPQPPHQASHSARRSGSAALERDRVTVVAGRHRAARRLDSSGPGEGKEGDHRSAVRYGHCSPTAPACKEAGTRVRRQRVRVPGPAGVSDRDGRVEQGAEARRHP